MASVVASREFGEMYHWVAQEFIGWVQREGKLEAQATAPCDGRRGFGKWIDHRTQSDSHRLAPIPPKT